MRRRSCGRFCARGANPLGVGGGGGAAASGSQQPAASRPAATSSISCCCCYAALSAAIRKKKKPPGTGTGKREAPRLLHSPFPLNEERRPYQAREREREGGGGLVVNWYSYQAGAYITYYWLVAGCWSFKSSEQGGRAVCGWRHGVRSEMREFLSLRRRAASDYSLRPGCSIAPFQSVSCSAETADSAASCAQIVNPNHCPCTLHSPPFHPAARSARNMKCRIVPEKI
jgi:hypothetical protein